MKNSDITYKTAAAYLRFSDKNQENILPGHDKANSIEYQMEKIKKYAKEHNIRIVAEYSDPACSGRDAENRPHFLEMIECAKANPKCWDYVIVYDLDRFSRNAEDAIKYENILLDCGIELLNTKDTPTRQTADTKLIKRLRYLISENESNKISEKTHDGMKMCSKDARHLGGIAPLGYDVVDGKYVINEAEADIVRLIFKMYLLGYTKASMADELNKRKYTTKVGSDFTKNSFSCILSNRKYIGEYSWDRRAAKSRLTGKRNNNKLKDPSEITVIPDAIPAIISKEDFDEVQKMLSKTKSEAKKGKSKRNYMLTSLNILRCSECGATMIGMCSKVYDKEYLKYRCPNHHGTDKGNKCKTKDLNVEGLDDFVASKIVEALLPDSCINRLNKQLSGLCINKSLAQQKKEYERRIQSLTNSLEKGDSDALLNRLMQNEAALKEIEEQLKDTKSLLIEDKEGLNSIRAYLKEVLMTSSDPEIKLFLKKYIKSISVSNEQIKVELQI